MTSLHTISYISRASESLSEADIIALLKLSTLTNNQNGITGILIHSCGNFLQVLEGQEDALIAVYEKIKVDERHDTVFEIYNCSSEYHVFNNYNARFSLLDSKTDLIALKNYLRRSGYSGDHNEMIQKLEPFLDLNEF